ncbi:GIY-YIG nuclease family protein [Flagellimonas zhangzhouensis]|uniref:Putative endonuclease n=1 Tax=Flagellimonas zhangzhouensis TaxID=1073328 RepID=A0A1H2YZA9_9FLAO|nr:GIY-YIG nuclease family protein [Allomuricauda zhangzhouensis]SDR04480.1 putative endonuclease [Allomuricauda zhangzhouensis]SDX10510.1 putative endonuclease [Allomuricauda zhangzhouensis]
MIKNVHEYYVYILTNIPNGTLYIGMTNDLERRILEHKTGSVEGFTKKYGLKTSIYFEVHQNVNEAILREKQLKKWKRQWKIELVEKENPKWKDLASGWYS